MASSFNGFDVQIDIEIENHQFLVENDDLGELLADLKYFIEHNKLYGKPIKTAYQDEINEFILGLAKTMGLNIYLPQKDELFDKSSEDKEL